MKLVNSQNRINELISRFVAQIEGGTSMGKTDLNKASETILIPLLNEVYGWNLENINYAEDNNNYPGIDLADEIAGISIQVTATPTLEKVKHTLEQFSKKSLYLKYSRLIIFILKKKQDSYSETTIQEIIQNRFNFDSRKNIWDYRDILKEVSNFQIDRTLRVQEILEANFGGERKLSISIVSSLEQITVWRKTCRELLNQWKGLRTNVLTTRNGVCFELDEMFVPLGVVERRQRPKHTFDGGSPEKGSELYEERVTPISQDAFFEQVLRQGQSKNSQGSRIAIIGEPGAGKTTQLQKIGDWILKETDGIPIWIPLAAVGTKNLTEYLLNDWLKTTTQELEISQQHRDELGQLLKTGKVWLLLDGVDEMAKTDALQQIATQMREGWLQNVRVVLTCRLNVWDAGKNALDRFDVYRNLDFDYPMQVHQFIGNWFVTEPELEQNLKSALGQSGKERIRDMVKKPLRLTLLCYSWQLMQGELPETKAGLYEWFVDAFYEWNKDKVPTKLSTTKRKELNRALGELAKEAIDQKSSRFRLREKFIEQFLGDADDEDSLFFLALQLGWLNCVGVAEENPLENVYAFFHPTFQEYFAALAIDDWDDFLPRNHENQPTKNRNGEIKYCIFEPFWEEVILLWLGRKNLAREQKEEFIFNLKEFKDHCGGFFWVEAFFLASRGLVEFESIHDAEIIRKLVEWGCYPNISSIHLWSRAQDNISRINKEIVCQSLAEIINTTEFIDVKGYAVELLEKVSKKSSNFQEILNSNSEVDAIYSERKQFRELYGNPIDSIWIEKAKRINQLTFNRKLSLLGLEDLFKDIEANKNHIVSTLVKIIIKNEKGLSSNQQELRDSIIVLKSILRNDYILSSLDTLRLIVTQFKDLVDDMSDFGDYNNFLWCCAQNMSYPDFYRAWHSSSPTTDVGLLTK